MQYRGFTTLDLLIVMFAMFCIGSVVIIAWARYLSVCHA